MRARHQLRLGAAALFTATAPLAVAQSGTEGPASGDVTELAPFSVTATHFPMAGRTLPISAEVLGAAELEAFAAITLPEILAQLAGVHVRNDSGSPARGTVDLRGQGEAAGQRVLVLVNGRRLNRPDLGGVNWLQIPAAQVARVEVLKGGQGVVHGDQAIGGVIKITTRESFQPGGEVGLLAGSYGLRQIQSSAHLPLGNHTLQLSANWLEQDGYRQNSGFDGTSLALEWTHLNPAGWTWNQHLQWVKTDHQLPGPLYSVGFPEAPRRSTVPGQDSRERLWILDSQLSHDQIGGGSLQLPLNLQAQQLEWSLPGAWGDNRLRSAQLRPRFARQLGPLTLTSGLDGIYDDFAFTGWASAERVLEVSRAAIVRQSAAAYSHALWEFDEAWRATAGLRLEHWRVEAENRGRSPLQPEAPLVLQYEEAIQDHGLAGTAGVVWQPGDAFRAWSRYDRLFRFPVTDELASYQGYALSTPFNRDLQPETGHSLELGAAWEAGVWSLQLALFGQRMDDEIQFDPITYLNANLPGSDRWGAELSAEARWSDFLLALSWTQLDAEVREGPFRGYTPALVPEEQGRLRLQWSPLGWLRLSGALRYTGRQYEGNYLALIEAGLNNPNPYLPGATVADAALELRRGERWTFRLVVENLADRDYATTKYQGGWYPAPGRAWKLQLAARF